MKFNFRMGAIGPSWRRRHGSSNLDLSFSKTTRILEGKNLQFRAEMFDGPNHVKFLADIKVNPAKV